MQVFQLLEQSKMVKRVGCHTVSAIARVVPTCGQFDEMKRAQIFAQAE
jgi:hypothetical protein